MTTKTTKPRSAKRPTETTPAPDPAAERLSMGDVATEYGGVHVSTVWRWAHVGVFGIKLRLYRIAGRRYTTRADLNAFKDAIDALDDPEPAHRPPSATNARAAKRVKNAEQQLDAVGI